MEAERTELADECFTRFWFKQLDTWFTAVEETEGRRGTFCRNLHPLNRLVIYVRDHRF